MRETDDLVTIKMMLVLIVVLVASVSAEIDFTPCPWYEPICASNGVTYDNECQFNRAVAEEDSSLTIKFQGTCEYSEWDQLICSKEKSKNICGSDGNNYSNQCYFEFAFKRNQILRKRNGGHCRTIEKTSEVCGSDGKKYLGSHFLAEQSVRPQLGVWPKEYCERPITLPSGPRGTTERPIHGIPPKSAPEPDPEIPTVCGSDFLIYEIRTFWEQKERRPGLKELPLSDCYYKPYFQG
ncbi:PREDICTED: ovoinhibitor-like [Nicrophorus vespilloides]|uniref:Ovoinhibitor-like n=1 Tax=Nicrophorus vespilloides TaxID=110193 RepID=A0ABM1MDB0_NICVS|nr:PREDICTED: ovoinhibitor-like [Nicrophorus vespilloides]